MKSVFGHPYNLQGIDSFIKYAIIHIKMQKKSVCAYTGKKLGLRGQILSMDYWITELVSCALPFKTVDPEILSCSLVVWAVG